MKRSVLAAVTFAAAVVASGGAARADEKACPAPPGAPAVANLDPKERLLFIRSVMKDQATRSSTWTWGWGATGVAFVAGNSVQAGLAKNATDRTDSIVAASTSVLVPVLMIVDPPKVIADRAALESAAASNADLCATLARGEELLARDADDQSSRTGLFPHALAVGFNVALGLTLGVGFGHWKGALLDGGGGIVVSEAQILSEPTGAVRALEDYRRGDLSAPAGGPSARARVIVAPTASQDQIGARFAVVF